jgi:putative SOS response-associated peptidase YedK
VPDIEFVVFLQAHSVAGQKWIEENVIPNDEIGVASSFAGSLWPHRTRTYGSPALTVAGLWTEWTEQSLKSCTMIITKPDDFVAEVHDRMPVLLADRDFEPWLRGETGVELLKPASNDLLQKWPVSKRVNSSRASDDDPTLIDRVSL